MKYIFSILIGLSLFGTAYASTISATPTANSNLQKGLIRWYTFDGKDSPWTSATAGTVIDRASGDTGTKTGLNQNYSPVAGAVGQGMYIGGPTGVTHDVLAGTTLSLNNSNFTLSLWVKTTMPGSGVGQEIISKANNSNSPSWRLFISRDTTYIEFMPDYFTTVQYFNGGYNAIKDGKWHLVTLTETAGVGKLYIDGVFFIQAATVISTANLDNASNNLVIGGFSTRIFDGSVDDVRIYNRALSAQEINDLWRLGQSKINVVPVVRLNQGLIGYWSLDGNAVVNNVADLSGTGNTGYLVPTTATSSMKDIGKVGQGLKFNGSTQYIKVPHNTSQNPTDVTFSYWVKPRVQQATTVAYLGKRLNATSGYIIFKLNSDNLLYWDWGGSPTYRWQTLVAGPTPGKWTHYVWTRNSTARTLYINGVYSTSTPNVGVNTGDAQTLTFGWELLNTYYLDGSMDEIRMYSRAVTAHEANALYRMGQQTIKTPVNRLTEGLVGYWTFDGKDSASGALIDRSGNNNTGYPTNIASSTFYTAGQLGQGLRFDGVNDYVKSPTFTLTAPNQITVSTWVKTGFSANSQTIVSSLEESTNGTFWLVRNINDNLKFEYSNSVNNFQKVELSTFFTGYNNTWVHVGVVADYVGNTVKIYRNGILVQSGGMTAPNKLTKSQLFIGSYNGSVHFLPGFLDDVRIYTRALTAKEINSLYQIGR